MSKSDWSNDQKPPLYWSFILVLALSLYFRRVLCLSSIILTSTIIRYDYIFTQLLLSKLKKIFCSTVYIWSSRSLSCHTVLSVVWHKPILNWEPFNDFITCCVQYKCCNMCSLSSRFSFRFVWSFSLWIFCFFGLWILIRLYTLIW